MKKRFCRFLKWKNKWMFLSLCAFTVLLISCEDEEKNSGVGKHGFLSLAVTSDLQYVPLSKAQFTDPEEADEYNVYILQGIDTVVSFLYKDVPEEIALEVGDYQVKANWGESVAAAFEALYMEGSENFSVKENQTTPVVITPIPANALVVVDYSEELETVYPGGYFIEMSTRYNTASPLVYEQDETRPAYFRAAEQESLNLDMFFSTTEEQYQFSDKILISPRDSVVLRVSLEEEVITDDPTLDIDVIYYEFPAEDPQPLVINIQTNCKDFAFSAAGSWFDAVRSSDRIIVVAEPNDGEINRVGVITITATLENKTISRDINLVQLHKKAGETEKPYIFGNPSTLVADQFTDQRIAIQSNVQEWDYKIVGSEDWVSVTQEGNSLLISSLSLNKGTAERTAKIALSGTLYDEEARDTISVIQTITVDPPAISALLNGKEVSTVPFTSEGGSQTLTINTNVSDWTVSIPSSDNWLTYTQTSNGLLLRAASIPSEESRQTLVTLTATASNGVVKAITLLVIQNGLDKPKVQLTIEINKEVIDTVVLTEGYEVENPTNRPIIYPYGFTSSTPFSIQKETSRSKFINIRIPNKIASCILQGEGSSYDLLEENNGSGIICSMNTGETLGVIYLDNFFNNLEPGSYTYTLEITDKEENPGTDSITIFITVTN